MSEKIDCFVQDILPSFFRGFNIPEEVIDVVSKDIKNRILSLLSHWNDIEYRKTLLLTGLEEAYFYKPVENLELRCFVVVAIRNSLFENLVSDKGAAKQLGLRKSPIPESEVKSLTEKAMIYFKNVNFEWESQNIIMNNHHDVYGHLKREYPVAWKAMYELGKGSNTAQVFEKIPCEPMVLEELKNIPITHKNFVVDVQSGIDEKLDSGLLNILAHIDKGYLPFFYTDSFKTLTRNIEKLFKVIEFVLRKDCIFITSNFYLSNGYVSKRKQLLRPAHTTKEIKENLRNFYGLRKTHSKYFKMISKVLLKNEN